MIDLEKRERSVARKEKKHLIMTIWLRGWWGDYINLKLEHEELKLKMDKISIELKKYQQKAIETEDFELAIVLQNLEESKA